MKLSPDFPNWKGRLPKLWDAYHRLLSAAVGYMAAVRKLFHTVANFSTANSPVANLFLSELLLHIAKVNFAWGVSFSREVG